MKKSVKGMRGSNIVSYIYATSNFGSKFRKEKVEGSRIETDVSSHERKIRFGRGELMFLRIIVRAKPQILQMLMKRKLEELSRHLFGSVVWSDLEIFLVPSPDGDFVVGLGLAIMNCKNKF